MSAEISVRKYKNGIRELLTGTSQLFPEAPAYLHRVKRVLGERLPDLWKPTHPTTFFPVSEAKIINGEIKEVHLSTFGLQQGQFGIEIDGKQKRETVYVNIMQDYKQGDSLSSKVAISDYDTNSKGQLIVEHKTTKVPEVDKYSINKKVSFNLSKVGMKSLSDLGLYTFPDESRKWEIEWDFKAKKWSIVDENKTSSQELQIEQIKTLRQQGFYVPDTIDEDHFIGVHFDTKINGKALSITVPAGVPRKDIKSAFLEGTPIAPLSVLVDNEEKVYDCSTTEQKDWHKSMTKISVTKEERAVLRAVGSKDDDQQLFIVPSTLFADSRIIVNLKKEKVGVGSPLSWAFQELVYNGLTDGESKSGIDVVMRYNSSNRREEVISEFIIKSKEGFRFKLESEMNSSIEHMKHSLKMEFSYNAVEYMKAKSDFLRDLLGEDPLLRTRMKLEWSDEKNCFVFREYTDNMKTDVRMETPCPKEVIKNIMGIDINTDNLRLNGAVAHFEATTDGKKYSVTVPSSFKDYEVGKRIREAKPIVPMSVFVEESGENVNILQ